MKLDDVGFNFLKSQEGCRLLAYQDQAGVWTIGYGCTEGVKPGDQITIDQAESLFKVQLAKYEIAVTEFTLIPITQNEFNALVSFTYNLGIKSFKSSTLLKYLNEGLRKGAADQFLVWCNIDGQHNQGLENRRIRERSLFLCRNDDRTS
jgi:lysozyme